jgi:hypothetical protein
MLFVKSPPAGEVGSRNGMKIRKPPLNKLLQKSDLLGQVRNLCLEFKTMMEQKKGAEPENRCQKASQLNSFRGFVRGIQQGFQAGRL